MAKKSEVNVIMFGPRRVGKTCILAAMSENFDRIANSSLVLTKDRNNDGQIDIALERMKGIFYAGQYGLPIETEDPGMHTDVIRNYYFNLSVIDSKSKSKHTIRFSDIPGEWIVPTKGNINEHEKDVEKVLSESDVIIIAIDAVFLMESNGIYNNQRNYCNNIGTWLKEKLQSSATKK